MQISDALSEQNETRAELKKSWQVNTNHMGAEEMLDLLGNWHLLTVYTLFDAVDGNITIDNISSRVGISEAEAKRCVETLIRIGALKKLAGPDCYQVEELFFDDSAVPAADLLSIFQRLSQVSLAKIRPRDCFGTIFEVMNNKIICKYLPEIYVIIQKIKDESKGLPGSQVNCFNFSFTKATRAKKSEPLKA